MKRFVLQLWLPLIIGIGCTACGRDPPDKTTGFRLAWTGPQELQICYVKAQISGFRNFFTVATEAMPRVQAIEIILKKVPALGECTTA